MFSLTVFVPLFGAPSIEYAIASQVKRERVKGKEKRLGWEG